MVDFSVEILAGELEIIARPVGIIIRLQFLAERSVAVTVPDAAIYVNYLPHAAEAISDVFSFQRANYSLIRWSY